MPYDKSALDDSREERWAFYEEMWNSPGFSKMTSNYRDLLTDQDVNAEWCEFLAGKIRGIVADPETADKLIPDHLYGQRRPPFGTNYYETYNNPKVSLVDLKATPILRVTRAWASRRADGVAASSTSSCGRPASTSAPVPSTGWASAVATASRWRSTGPTARAPTSAWPAAASRTSSSPAVRTGRPATTRGTAATRSTS